MEDREIKKDIKLFNECIDKLKEIGNHNLSLFTNNLQQGNTNTIKFLFDKYIKRNKELLKENADLQKSVDKIYADYQDIGKEMFKCNEENENLKNENNELKAVILKNHDLYESKCNQNTKLEEENKELKKVKTDEFILNNPWLFKYLSEVYIPKSLVKEKIEELLKKLDEPNNNRWEENDDIYYNQIKAQIRILKDLLGKEK